MEAGFLTCSLVVLAVVLALSSCSTRNVKLGLSVEEHYRRAVEMLGKEDYIGSIREFQFIIYTYPGSKLIDDAQYGLAESYYGNCDYTDAIFEYQRIVNDFPLSEYADDAQFTIGICFFERSLPPQCDQTDTYRAIEELKRFIEDYPESELVDEAKARILDCRNKLAKKAFETAKLYRKLGEKRAGMIYFEEVIKNYNDSNWFSRAKYEIGEILLEEGKIEEATRIFRSLARGSPDGEVKIKAKIRLEEIELKVGDDVNDTSK